jgi:hypothetical protein
VVFGVIYLVNPAPSAKIGPDEVPAVQDPTGPVDENGGP